MFFCVSGFLLLCQYNLLGWPSFVSKERKAFHGLLFFCWGRHAISVIWHLGRRMVKASTLSLIKVLLQGPLAWALIVWRCSLVFSSFDKIVSVLIHLLPGELDPHFSAFLPFSTQANKICDNRILLLWWLSTFYFIDLNSYYLVHLLYV